MATYAIGDVQGCYRELRCLLDHIRFDPAQDQLWFVGDLVNRGPDSLSTLRFIKGLEDRAISVLGNHDLHLLAIAAGNTKYQGSNGLSKVLSAPDRDELVNWLQHRPLMHRDKELGFSMLHAGLPPGWDIKTAMRRAAEVEARLRSDDSADFFEHMYGNKPKKWDKKLKGMDRLRYITNCFTRLRYCDRGGRLALKEKGSPGKQKSGYIPWFKHPKRASRDERIVFGHWSTLGYLAKHNVWSIDTGCLWGGALTALRIDLDEPSAINHRCEQQVDPASQS